MQLRRQQETTEKACLIVVVGAPLKGAKSSKNRSDTAEYVLSSSLRDDESKELDCDKQSNKRVRRSMTMYSSAMHFHYACASHFIEMAIAHQVGPQVLKQYAHLISDELICEYVRATAPRSSEEMAKAHAD